ncbi:hypothetical protein LCGC14_3013790, partial [marine sediment metagenome]
MMRIWVPGANGLLGRAVCKIAAYRDHIVTATLHSQVAIDDLNLLAVEALRPLDAIINCAGVLPGRGYREAVLTNALGPHDL